MRVSVFGAGYVGLVTGVTFSYLGIPVTLIDINADRVAKIMAAVPPIYEQHLESLLQDVRASGRLVASTSAADGIQDTDIIFIAVNTPSLPTGEADMQYVQSAALAIGRHLNPEGRYVVVNKSTVPIGSANLVRVWVEDGYRETHHGENPRGDLFAVASNPEFLREGQALRDSFYPDRIVVGADTQWAEDLLLELYTPLIDQTFKEPPGLARPSDKMRVPVAVTDRVSAEMVKYAANAFLATKISFANEMASIAEHIGADITAVMQGIGMDRRIGRDFLNAGVGWGGSCFGKDLAALIHTAHEYSLKPELLEATVHVNHRQRLLIVKKLQARLKTLKGRRIAVLGLAFKPGTDDLRDAPAYTVIRELASLQARVVAYDPVAMDNACHAWHDIPFSVMPSALETLQGAEAGVILTDWPEFRDLPWAEIRAVMDRPIIIDGRNLLPAEHLRQLGYTYEGVGL